MARALFSEPLSSGALAVSKQPSRAHLFFDAETRAGRQRYKCKSCSSTFTETKGTIFYRRRTPDDKIIETLALLAEGSRISSLTRVKGYKEDTILAWLRDAAEHAEAIEEELMSKYQIGRGQLDGLWAYVGNKGEKKATRKRTKAASSGDPQ